MRAFLEAQLPGASARHVQVTLDLALARTPNPVLMVLGARRIGLTGRKPPSPTYLHPQLQPRAGGALRARAALPRLKVTARRAAAPQVRNGMQPYSHAITSRSPRMTAWLLPLRHPEQLLEQLAIECRRDVYTGRLQQKHARLHEELKKSKRGARRAVRPCVIRVRVVPCRAAPCHAAPCRDTPCHAAPCYDVLRHCMLTGRVSFSSMHGWPQLPARVYRSW